jgi:hypothetical protein
MGGQFGVKESVDVINAAGSVGAAVLKVFKDGVQFSDLTELYSQVVANEEVRNAILEAYNGVSAVPTELGEVDMEDGLELAKAGLDQVPKFLSALKE